MADLGAHDPLWPGGVVNDALGSDGDTATDSSTGVRWVKEPATSVWVPQTLDIARIVPSASQVAWLDGGDRVMGVDPDVATLTDLFGNSNSPTQATAASRPHIDRDGLGGTQVINFDGTDDTMTKGSASGPGTNAFDVFLLVRAVVWENNVVVFELGASGNRLQIFTTTAPAWSAYHDEGGTPGTAATSDGSNDTDWHLVRAYVPSDGSTVGIQIDGGTPATTTGDGTLGSKTDITLGSTQAAGQHSNIDIATVVIASSVLPLGRRIALTRAINFRYKTGRLFAEPTA